MTTPPTIVDYNTNEFINLATPVEEDAAATGVFLVNVEIDRRTFVEKIVRCCLLAVLQGVHKDVSVRGVIPRTAICSEQTFQQREFAARRHVTEHVRALQYTKNTLWEL